MSSRFCCQDKTNKQTNKRKEIKRKNKRKKRKETDHYISKRPLLSLFEILNVLQTRSWRQREINGAKLSSFQLYSL